MRHSDKKDAKSEKCLKLAVIFLIRSRDNIYLRTFEISDTGVMSLS